MQHGVGRAAHGDVQSICVFKCFKGGNATRQNRFVAFDIIGLRHVDNAFGRSLKEFPAQGVRGEYGAVAGQSQAYGFIETVHAVGGKHTRAGAAGGAG